MSRGLFVDIKKKLPGFRLSVWFDTNSGALGFLGASGSGKSMTLRCIAGLEKPDTGKIVLNGRVLFDSEKNINISCKKRKIGFLFQNYALFPNMTVEENIGFALGSLDKKQRNTIIREKIEMVKLKGLEKRYPLQLSGGQQQRVALARALAVEPEVLMLDEPFSALDDNLRSHMVKQLIETIGNYSGNTLFVTHNREEAYRVCDKLLILSDGRVEAHGDKEKVFQSPPTLETARLTGCKNISKAVYLSSDELEAVEWGIKLKPRAGLSKKLMYVGIRAHYIRIATKNDECNVFNCHTDSVIESPFRVTVYLTIERDVWRKSLQSEDHQLKWEISKEKWIELKEQPLPWKIYLNPEKLMVFEK